MTCAKIHRDKSLHSIVLGNIPKWDRPEPFLNFTRKVESFIETLQSSLPTHRSFRCKEASIVNRFIIEYFA